MRKKKKISDPVKKQLWLSSGGYCYKCKNPLITREGVYIGKIAHIEGEKPNSARFNKKQSEEQKSGFDNLIVVCGNCHDEIDKGDIQEYSVEYLKKLKTKHENKMKDIMETFTVTVGNHDYTAPQNLNAYYRNAGLTTNEIEQSRSIELKEISTLLEILDTLSIETRKIILLIINYGKRGYGDVYEIDFDYLNTTNSLEANKLAMYLNILSDKELIYTDEDNPNKICLQFRGSEIENWFSEIYKFYKEFSYDINEFIVDLDLSLMDE
ncbi:hypothetical protein ACYSNW_13050 [Enterococcus sp. LJL99]